MVRVTLVAGKHPKRWVPGVRLERRHSGWDSWISILKRNKHRLLNHPIHKYQLKMHHRPKWINQKYKTSRKIFCDLKANISLI